MDIHTDLTLSQTDHRPMYLQIMDQIRHRVAAGDWPPGREIPSIRAMAAGLSISVITVKRAYLELERDGVIITRQGKGSFISDNPGLGSSLQQQALDAHLQDAIDSASLLGLDDQALLKRLQSLQQLRKEKKV
ncbi:GntR family transcriptional regulator [Pseudohongiella acticola]|nr:GntR family transcriptional regulator [Pseudohongiella acticola]